MHTPNSYPGLPRAGSLEARHSEKGYPLLFFHPQKSCVTTLLTMIVIIGAGIAAYIWYSHSSFDTTPDSTAGLAYGVIGTVFFLLAAISYSVRRRSRKRAMGQLHTSLNWHVCFAIMGLATIVMHSFGHFSLISGTFALYGLIALSISGLIGRMLDRIMPRLIARDVDTVLSARGDDLVETVSQELQAIVVHNTQGLRGFTLAKPERVDMPTTTPAPFRAVMPTGIPFVVDERSLQTPWDLAYISLEPTRQELDRQASHYRFVPDKKSALERPGALMPGAEEHISALRQIQHAMRREQFYRYVIRGWRILHICLAFVTTGLIIWHLIFAATLLWPRFISH
ncbi:MAG TPA: hypothetical protein VKR42_08725 [Ktedonobacteraceae bacterium]|nr:hypothetical protein [Ktedonobacteraceae bacterium]